eukprot:CAMPEP_0176259206 /NCGR_PEP_ID=MMETSP0121_2-20121125/38956_1 /TAXON_ID=160619 /ORGANISM="Kryptoperidinium foliaceum, Strain CCMP 1326" /LENGTH=39 /DNA_ID= /DNA_START= /DNA_END= /DNA_ORIENTATION=
MAAAGRASNEVARARRCRRPRWLRASRALPTDWTWGWTT